METDIHLSRFPPPLCRRCWLRLPHAPRLLALWATQAQLLLAGQGQVAHMLVARV